MKREERKRQNGQIERRRRWNLGDGNKLTNRTR